MNKPITPEQAIALHETRFWEKMSFRERAEFQLYTECLCMPFEVFHEAVEKTLGRPVWTHEFAFAENLQKEMRGERPAPSLTEIMDLIPAEKRIIVAVGSRRAARKARER